MRNAKLRKTIYDLTIAETMFCVELLLNNREAEDRILEGFYREWLPGVLEEKQRIQDDGDRDGPDADALVRDACERIWDRIHEALETRQKKCGQPDYSVYVTDMPDSLQRKRIDGVIAAYYKDRRAAYKPDVRRVRRLYQTITR